MNPKLDTAPLILAIDTSCDDTSAAVTLSRTVLSNVIASQTQLHKQYGGVFPTVAKQAHKENIGPTVTAALRRSQVTPADISAIAVTQGPGLAPALEVGITYAKELATTWNKPLIPVNHIEGHVLSVLARRRSKDHQVSVKNSFDLSDVQFPSLAVVISGGHSEFILVKEPGQYQRLGWKLDDAAGEVLDKVGRMLDLGYPAGPVMEEFAEQGDEQAFTFPLPMTTSHDYHLSFSGLKTFARNKIEALSADKELNKTQIYDFCASFQYAICRAICYKLNKILLKYEVKEVWFGGGVAANKRLREMIRQTSKQQSSQIPLRVPYTKKLCSDNAAMIGVAAGWQLRHHTHVKNLVTIERQPRLTL